MGLFGNWFGKKKPAPIDDDRPAPSSDVQGPPEFVRAVELQRAYWTHDAAEEARLEASTVEELPWRDVLRLHHLYCLQRLNAGPERASAEEKCRQTLRRLMAAESPYRPRVALVWQGELGSAQAERQPNHQGMLLNASLTHLGVLEVYRLDADGQPTSLDFIAFDELAGIAFAPAKLIRAAKLFFDDRRAEVVLLPLLYGLTWTLGNEYDRDGRMTRFVSHLANEELGQFGVTGMGVGQQDFTVVNREGGASLFGLGSVAEIAFPLDLSDPRFDDKARARGIDPDEARRRVG